MSERAEADKGVGLDRRVSQRKRQVAEGLRRVDDDTRKLVAAARLEALENDRAPLQEGGGDESDEYVVSSGVESEEEEPALRMPGAKAKKKEKVVKRKTRHHPTGTSSRARQGAKPFALLLEEADVGHVDRPTYVTAAAPASVLPPRAFCSVCGFTSGYSCVRCGARFCSRRCHVVHADTRCMKFTI